MPIKLLALDLDGTIVTDLHDIPPRVQTAIKAATAQGVQVVIATGREYPVSRKFIELLGLRTPVICYQGALIYDPVPDRIIASETIPLPLAHHLIDQARAQQLALHLYFGHQAFVEAPTALSRALLTRTGILPAEVNDLKQAIESPPLKGLIVHPAGEAGAAAARLATAISPKLSVFRSHAELIEVTSPKVSKGHALATLAGHYGIPQQEVMAIGDQDNDIEMIAWAGLGVAMGNASPGAKDAADHLAPPITEDGAAWAIEKFILSES
jgi:Cof subfamily protein (haloacid dehalogenase superfamily)